MFFSFCSERKEPKERRPGQSRPDVHRDSLATDKKPGPAESFDIDNKDKLSSAFIRFFTLHSAGLNGGPFERGMCPVGGCEFGEAGIVSD